MNSNRSKSDLFTTLRNAPGDDYISHALLCAFAEMAIYGVDMTFATRYKDVAAEMATRLKDTGFTIDPSSSGMDFYLRREKIE
ncbi:MAG TPA: hypothetical protein PKJ68_05945 [Candidatus Woesebacteria bacterium]|nr:hypothetical protein [Candidatus Woesebacteria bacterium]